MSSILKFEMGAEDALENTGVVVQYLTFLIQHTTIDNHKIQFCMKIQ